MKHGVSKQQSANEFNVENRPIIPIPPIYLSRSVEDLDIKKGSTRVIRSGFRKCVKIHNVCR